MRRHNKKGFFTIAQNSGDVDYVRMAYGLALSLKHSQSTIKDISIGITPGTRIDPRYEWAFDEVIEIPWGDHAEGSTWKLENEWKSIWMSPYEETMKVEADMLFFSDVSLWWEKLASSPMDVIWTNRVLDWRGASVTSDFYRKAFTANELPNIYTGCGYFKKTDDAFEIFEMAKMVFWNWQTFYEIFLEPKTRPDHFSTDVAFAITMKMIDIDQNSYTPGIIPTFTHMKSQVQGIERELSEDWREHLKVFFTQAAECKIGNHRQYYPLHYHLKDFLTDEMLVTYERLLEHV